MTRFRFAFNEHRGTLLALAIFLVMFTLYVANHPAQWTVFQKRWPGSERPGEE